MSSGDGLVDTRFVLFTPHLCRGAQGSFGRWETIDPVTPEPGEPIIWNEPRNGTHKPPLKSRA